MKNAAPATERPCGRTCQESARTAKFHAIGHQNHQLVGCTSPFIAPRLRRRNSTIWKPATGIEYDNPRFTNRETARSVITSMVQMNSDESQSYFHLPWYP